MTYLAGRRGEATTGDVGCGLVDSLSVRICSTSLSRSLYSVPV